MFDEKGYRFFLMLVGLRGEYFWLSEIEAGWGELNDKNTLMLLMIF